MPQGPIERSKVHAVVDREATTDIEVQHERGQVRARFEETRSAQGGDRSDVDDGELFWLPDRPPALFAPSSSDCRPNNPGTHHQQHVLDRRIPAAVAALLLGRSPFVDLYGPRLVGDPLLYAWGRFHLVVLFFAGIAHDSSSRWTSS